MDLLRLGPLGKERPAVRVDEAVYDLASVTAALQIEQSGGQWSKGKACPTFCPLGPALIPADELNASALRLRSFVNGEPRQDSSTADMIFPVATLLHDLSQYMALEPGDVILTGTAGGGALRPLPPSARRGPG